MDKIIIISNAVYLDWFNNFLSVASFAEHYGMKEKAACAAIEDARQRNHALYSKS